VSVAAGAAAGAWIVATKLVTGAPVFVAHGPLLLLSALLVETGVVLIGMGLLAELLTRIYMDGRRRRIYALAPRKHRPTRHAWAGPQPVTANRSRVLQ
jgi:hypothetical protein